MDTKTLVFMTITSDVLMTLENVSKKERWSTILEKIATKEWYQMWVKWSFLCDTKILEPDAVLESEDAVISITCVKIVVPQITFEFPKGKFLVSIPFDNSRSCITKRAYLTNACTEAHEKLMEMAKNGTDTTKIYPYPLDLPYKYIFYDNNGEKLDYNNVLKVPEDNNLIIEAELNWYCNRSCRSCGPSCIGETALCGKISICPNCDFLHCLFCGICGQNVIDTTDCRASCNM